MPRKLAPAAALIGMRTWLLVVLVACGGTLSSSEVGQRRDRANASNADRAAKAYTTWRDAHRELHESTTPSIQVDMSSAQRPQGVGSDGLMRDPATGHVWILAAQCVSGSSCGCDAEMTQRVLTADDGRVVVVRMTPKINIQRVHMKECAQGCGHPAPEMPVSMLDLGVSEPEKVSVSEIEYVHDKIEMVCDHTLYPP